MGQGLFWSAKRVDACAGGDSALSASRGSNVLFGEERPQAGIVQSALQRLQGAACLFGLGVLI